MTLIITEISNFGIVMVTDSALTHSIQLPSGEIIQRVLHGGQKLQLIPYLNAGISVWGGGTILFNDISMPTDVWLNYFIDRNNMISSLKEFAETLALALQALIGNTTEPLGFHIAGYVEQAGVNVPTLYHVRNVDGNYFQVNFHDFIAGHQPIPELSNENPFYILRNGDFGPYSMLFNAVNNHLPFVTDREGNQLIIPHPSLQGRILYHSAWIKFISELYRSADFLGTIGGETSALGITPDGKIAHYTGV